MIYYETAKDGEIQAHNTLEEAMQFADENRCEIICEIGGHWAEWQKCAFCDNWEESVELNAQGYCTYCEQAIKSRGEY